MEQAVIVNKVVVRPEQRLNAQLDKEVDKLSQNFMHIVSSTKLGDKDQATLAREMYETDVYAHNIVRSAQSLLTITHELKRALLLYDFQAIGEGYRERTKELDRHKEQLEEQALLLRTDLSKSLHDLEVAYNASTCK